MTAPRGRRALLRSGYPKLPPHFPTSLLQFTSNTIQFNNKKPQDITSKKEDEVKMILSAYRNPPYRSPTPKNKPPQPNQQPSPKEQTSPNKRKRSNSTDTIPSTPSPLRIDTITRIQDEEVEIPASPRTKVADTFSKLRLAREESPKKKLKREDTTQTPERSNSLEILETPQPAIHCSPSRSPTQDPNSPTPMDLAQETPLPDDPDPSALTWQDSEITGHLISPDEDDDGEGINGIGFKPTSAMAYARSQKRKQQVSEWKVREAREARQRRLEKRRGGDCGDEGRAGQRVRFLDVE